MDASIVTAFLTGLTAGGLSCMAVQGGLVTSSLAGQIESEISSPKRGNKSAKTDRAPLRLARPIVLFLAAKLLAYTALGFVLGSIGSALSLTPTLRGILQILLPCSCLGMPYVS